MGKEIDKERAVVGTAGGGIVGRAAGALAQDKVRDAAVSNIDAIQKSKDIAVQADKYVNKAKAALKLNDNAKAAKYVKKAQHATEMYKSIKVPYKNIAKYMKYAKFLPAAGMGVGAVLGGLLSLIGTEDAGKNSDKIPKAERGKSKKPRSIEDLKKMGEESDKR